MESRHNVHCSVQSVHTTSQYGRGEGGAAAVGGGGDGACGTVRGSGGGAGEGEQHHGGEEEGAGTLFWVDSGSMNEPNFPSTPKPLLPPICPK